MSKNPKPLFQKRNSPPPGMINFVNIFITPPKTFQFDLGVAGKEILPLSALYRSCQFLPLSDRTKGYYGKIKNHATKNKRIWSHEFIIHEKTVIKSVQFLEMLCVVATLFINHKFFSKYFKS